MNETVQQIRRRIWWSRPTCKGRAGPVPAYDEVTGTRIWEWVGCSARMLKANGYCPRHQRQANRPPTTAETGGEK